MLFRGVPTALLLLLAILFLVLTHVSSIALSERPLLVSKATSNHISNDVSACKLPAVQRATLSVGFGYNLHCVRPVGKITAFVIFVDFPDSPDSDPSAQKIYDAFIPDAVSWFQHMSYGRLSLEVKSDMKFYRLASSSDTFRWKSGAGSDEIMHKYVLEALYAYADNRRFVPSADMLYIIPTPGASNIVQSTQLPRSIVNPDGSLITWKVILFGMDMLHVFQHLAIVHETYHTFCLADLYIPTDIYPAFGHFTGGFSIMGDAVGSSPDVFAWDKWRLGWIDDQDIDCVSTKGSTRHVLTPLYSKEPGVKAVVIARGRESALVAEYRLDKGIDVTTCSPGLLLYTVHTDIPTLHGPIRVVDANPNTNGCDNVSLNDATLNMKGRRLLSVDDFGVTVQLKRQSERQIVFDVVFL